MKPESKEDIAVSLVSNGFAMVEKRKEKRLQKLLSTYRKAQDQAKKNRVCCSFPIFLFCAAEVYFDQQKLAKMR